MEFERYCLNLGFCCLAAAAAWTDGKERRLPDGVIKALAVLGLAARVWKALGGSGGVLAVLGEGALGALAGAGIFLFLLLVWPGAFGGGDVKFLAAGGIFLGPAGTAVAFVLSVLLAGGSCVLRRRDGREEIPFGPFLAAGMGIACWWGEALWRWYVG